MISFELKKILLKPSNKIALLILSVVIVIMSYLTVGSIEYVDSAGNVRTGITAYDKLKEVKNEWKGSITEDVLQKVIENNSEINNSEEYLSKNVTENNIAYSRKQGFSDIRTLINYSFCDFQEYDYYRADTVLPSETDNFYPNRINKLKIWLSSDSMNGNFTKEEKEYLIKKYEEIPTPFYYEYAGGWTALLDYLPTFIMLITLIGTFLISGIFSDEFRLKADSVFFTTKNGRSKAVKSKIVAGFICITVIYWIPVCCFTGIVFGCLGTDGAEGLIQTGLGGWKSFYNITFLQEFFLTIAGGYIGALFILTLSMLISAKTHSSVLAVTAPFGILLIPSFLANFSVLTKALGILPDQLLQIGSAIKQFNLYQFGGTVIPAIPIIFVVYLVCYFFMLPLLYQVYKRSGMKA